MPAPKKKTTKARGKLKDLKTRKNPKGGVRKAGSGQLEDGVSPRGRTPGKINLN